MQMEVIRHSGTRRRAEIEAEVEPLRFHRRAEQGLGVHRHGPELQDLALA